jgi:predicted phage terminase large subunit-like protein
MGKWPGHRIILTSYAAKLAEKQSRRCQAICRSDLYRNIWGEAPVLVRDAVGDWGMSNGSEMLASGIKAGITGNRANGAIVDDPVAGREEADSPIEQQNTVDAYQDDLLSRLLPAAWLAVILTHWNENDLAGKILPESWKGESGMITCRDGLVWEVLNIQAKCERADDPLGRAQGEYLWPEYYPVRHWEMFEKAQGPEAARAWSSLYQQRPSPQGAGAFKREWFNWYGPGELPVKLRLAGASDFAVSAGKNDFTEHSLWGVDLNSGLWLMEGWSGQVSTDVSIEELLNIAKRKKVTLWFDESGVIHKAIGPALNKRMRERKIFLNVVAVPSTVDKVTRLQSFQARAASGCVYLPKNSVWAEQLVEQLIAIPAGRYDDKADCAGLIGRVIDQISPPFADAPREPRGIKPFTGRWVEHDENAESKKLRYR